MQCAMAFFLQASALLREKVSDFFLPDVMFLTHSFGNGHPLMKYHGLQVFDMALVRSRNGRDGRVGVR